MAIMIHIKIDEVIRSFSSLLGRRLVRFLAGAFSIFLLTSGAGVSCEWNKALYGLEGSRTLRLRIGSDPTGDVIYAFTNGSMTKAVDLAQIADRVQIARMDAQRRPMSAQSVTAPAYLRLRGFDALIGFGDGDWRILRCLR